MLPGVMILTSKNSNLNFKIIIVTLVNIIFLSESRRSEWTDTSSKRKITQAAWTPEHIAPLLCDDVTCDDLIDEFDFEKSKKELEIQWSPQKSSRKAIKVGHSNSKFSNNSKHPFISIVQNRASSRVKLLVNACYGMSNACNVALSNASEQSIGAKLWRESRTKVKVLLARNNQDTGLRCGARSSVLNDTERKEFIKKADALLKNVNLALKDQKIWKKINEKDGVIVWKSEHDVKNYPSKLVSNDEGDDDFATIRSEAYMSASPKQVFDLFMDSSRVHEYNDNCQELEDLEFLSETSKVSWSATGRIGPFSARDFVTLITSKPFGSGYVSLAVFIDHPKLSSLRKGYVRSKIQLAATFMEAVPGKPNVTKFIQVTQVGELGGVANNAMAKRMANNLAERAPVDFMKKFNIAVKRTSSPHIDRKEI